MNSLRVSFKQRWTQLGLVPAALEGQGQAWSFLSVVQSRFNWVMSYLPQWATELVSQIEMWSNNVVLFQMKIWPVGLAVPQFWTWYFPTLKQSVRSGLGTGTQPGMLTTSPWWAKRIEFVLRSLGEFKPVHKCRSGFPQDQRVMNAKVMLWSDGEQTWQKG